MDRSKNTKNIFVFGFALFATFFGAGNLIFPPYLGIISGPEWFKAFLGFSIADGGLALLAVIAISKYNGNIDSLFGKSGKTLAKILAIADILCVGPLLVIPRTGATTYEMGILPVIGNKIPIWLFVIIFFVITYLLTIKPSKVVDIVGQFLTPVLLIALAVIIVKGVVNPIGKTVADPMIPKVFSRGLLDGYQTMDAFVSIAIGSVLVASLHEKGYHSPKAQTKLLTISGVVACIGLSLVYGGLFFLGSTVSTRYGVNTEQSQVIVNITNILLGNGGKIVLGIVVSLACLTTAIGLTSATAKFFSELSNGKIMYEKVVLAVCVFSAVIASIGVSNIVSFAVPILSILYPPTICLIVLTFFKDRITNNNIYKASTYMAIIMGVMTVISDKFQIFDFVNNLPLAQFGFNWVVPVLIAGIIGSFIKPKNNNSAIGSFEEVQL